MLGLPKKDLKILQEWNILDEEGDLTDNIPYQDIVYMIQEKILSDEGIYYLINTYDMGYSDIGTTIYYSMIDSDGTFSPVLLKELIDNYIFGRRRENAERKEIENFLQREDVTEEILLYFLTEYNGRLWDKEDLVFMILDTVPEKASSKVVGEMIKDEKIAWKLLESPEYDALYPENLEYLIKNNDPAIKIAVTRYISYSEYDNSKYNVIKQLSKDKDEEVRESVADIVNLPKDIAISLAEDSSSEVIVNLLNSNELPKHTIIDLYEEYKDDINSSYFIYQKNITDDILIDICKNNPKDYHIQDKLLNIKKLPIKIIEFLSNSIYQKIKEKIALNPNLTEKVMIKLANDEEENVRWWLVLNPNLT